MSRGTVAHEDAECEAARAGGGFGRRSQLNGGCGSYSIASWSDSATSRPWTRSVSDSAMSIPDETPAPLTWLPCHTTQSPTTSTPIARRLSWNAQWAVVHVCVRPAADHFVGTDHVERGEVRVEDEC